MHQEFSHRFNTADGTVDSICHRCFQTVATASREDDLEIPEERHTCDPAAELRYALMSNTAAGLRERHV